MPHDIQPPHKEWRSRDAAERLIKALQDPGGRPRWMLGTKSSRHKRGKNPSVIIKAIGDVEYPVKALRNNGVVKMFRKDHPNSDAVVLAIAPDEPMSQIRRRVFTQIDRVRQKAKKK